MVFGKWRSNTRNSASNVRYNGIGCLQYAPSSKAHSKAQIDVFKIAEVAFIKPANIIKRRTSHQHGSGAGAKRLAHRRRSAGHAVV
jgi:hypothetical protein